MLTPGSSNKFLFLTFGGRILEVGDYSNRGYYSDKYGIYINKPHYVGSRMVDRAMDISIIC